MTQPILAIVTIGQAPRSDLHEDLAHLLGDSVTIREYGALDPFTLEEVNQHYPIEGKTDLLVSRMRDGRQVTISEQDLEPLLAQAVEKALSEVPNLVVVLCTGDLPLFAHPTIRVLSPKRIVGHFFLGLGTDAKLLVMSPAPEQMVNTKARWLNNGFSVQCLYGSPYLSDGQRQKAALEAAKLGGDMLYLDCMGYSVAQGTEIAKLSSKSVLTPRQIIFSTVKLALNA